MRPLGFRKRLLLALILFSLVPAAVVTLAWATVTWSALPLVTAGAAWARVTATGDAAIAAARSVRLDASRSEAIEAHARELAASAVQARRLNFVTGRLAPIVFVAALIVLAFLGLAASRVAGHLSRQLSRPLQELVGWTHLIRESNPLPAEGEARGAPEFGLLRDGMRAMATELTESRARAVEAERLVAYRETARRVAHELKNPLTPMQFALAQLKRTAAPEAQEPLRVLEEETARLQRLATSFSQFGTLPTGPAAAIDVGELLRTTVTACVPSHLAVRYDLPADLPSIVGHHDPLQRAVMNVVLNAVDACGNAGTIGVTARPHDSGVALEVADSGPGIPPDVLPRVFEPYLTRKAGGTGLGLAIARHAVETHGGRIVASSPATGGALIRIELPRTPPAPAEART